VVVGLNEPHEEPDTVQPYPFLLNVSLRRTAPNGVNLQSAIAQSGAKGF
jgi:hypothetical protein